ncbi:MAG TPA: DUF2163 domain-containing protein [Pyrinomonadaceae bacterium]|jgi:uncharacterized phage protein (TIGR02218 family)
MPETVINYVGPYTAQSLLDHIGTATPTTAVCWKLKPDPASPLHASGLEIRATSHDRQLVLPGHGSGAFLPGVAGLPTTIDTESGHESAGLQYETVFSSAGITRDALAAGDWVKARVEIYTVNVAALNMGQLVEFAGFLGKADEEGEMWKAEARPLTAVGQAQIGRLTSARCTVRRLGDARCKVNLNAPAAGDGGAILVNGTLTQVVSVTRVRASALTQTGNYFELIKFTSGALNGREYEVREYDPTNKEFILRDPMHMLPAVGNTFRATRRCNRDPADCVRVYANIINNRGYRFITNVEQINKIQRAS